MPLTTYERTASGGMIGRDTSQFTEKIDVYSGEGDAYITIQQGGDEVRVTEAQVQWLLDAINRAGIYLRWAEWL